MWNGGEKSPARGEGGVRETHSLSLGWKEKKTAEELANTRRGASGLRHTEMEDAGGGWQNKMGYSRQGMPGRWTEEGELRHAADRCTSGGGRVEQTEGGGNTNNRTLWSRETEAWQRLVMVG